MKSIILILLAAVLFFGGCSKDSEFNSAPTAPSSLDAQAELNRQILAEIPEALLKEIPETEQAEVRAGRLFIWYLQGQGDFPNPAGRCAPLLTVNISGTGIGTYIGRFADEQSHCLNPATFEFVNGFAVFTSVRSDEQLFINYWGALAPTSDPTVLQINGNTTIDGGIGKFDGATGQGTARGTLNVSTGEAQLVGVGTLDLNTVWAKE